MNSPPQQEEKIIVFDHAFSFSDTERFFCSLISATFSPLGGSSRTTAGIDEVMTDLHATDLESHPIGIKAKELLNQMSGKKAVLKDALVNMSRVGDVSFSHQDSTNECAWSVLYFANSSWEEKWEGELLIFRPSGIVAIAPKPGRFVLFPSSLWHRAGIPSHKCSETRITVSLRFVV